MATEVPVTIKVGEVLVIDGISWKVTRFERVDYTQLGTVPVGRHIILTLTAVTGQEEVRG